MNTNIQGDFQIWISVPLNSSIHIIATAITDNITITNPSIKPLHIESFFITPTDSSGVSNFISSLNQDKSDGPNSIPTRILKLLNKDISDQLAFLFNQSFSSGLFIYLFFSIVKNNKIIPISKKRLKVGCSNYRSISLHSNIPERLVYNRLCIFLEKKELKYSLQFGLMLLFI